MSEHANRLASFRVGDGLYGIPVLLVEEFFRPVRPTPVPGADRRLAGIINLRGTSACVVDLRPCLGVPGDPPPPGQRRMILLETASSLVPEAVEAGLTAFAEPVALLVDRVESVIDCSGFRLHPPPAHVAQRFITGLYEIDGGYLSAISVTGLIDDILGADNGSTP